jgi:anti-sigma regulatory factor (Ser/Thr protein kinase)
LAARIELATELSELSRMDAWLAREVTEAGALPAAAQAVRLCLHELVANVIQHGYPDGRDGCIRVTVAPAGAALHVTLEDDGIAFDPLAAPEAMPMTGLADAQVGGYGIKLFRESSHGARYVRQGEVNRLSFTCG